MGRLRKFEPSESDGFTVCEIARRMRVSEEKVRGWITSGRLKAVNTSDGRKPRFVVAPADLERFLEGLAAVPAPAPAQDC
jgi:excisionase family DNA binding protein